MKSSEIKKIKTGSGWERPCFIIMGIFCLFIPIPIISWIIGGLLIIGAFTITKYEYKGLCPYCGNNVTIPVTEEPTYTCEHCKHICNIRENRLETINFEDK